MLASRILKNPPLNRLRLANNEDVPFIMELVNQSVAKNFRIKCNADLVYLIENCVLCISQLNTKDELVGFLAVRDYPPVPAVHPNTWEDFVWTKYKAVDLNARNTLFVHCLCWNPVYSREVVDSMLKSLFMHDPYLHYIAMMKCDINYLLLVAGQARAELSFKRIQAMERGLSGDQIATLCVAERRDVCPRLRIRKAVEEDNDDIVPIIDRQSTRLKDIYGEFYVSELISRHPESERVLLVCEQKELAVGVMCLNTQINYEQLEENFDLSPFSGLRRIDDDDCNVEKPLKDQTQEFSSSVLSTIGVDPCGQNPPGPGSGAGDYEDKLSPSGLHILQEEASRIFLPENLFYYEGVYTPLDILNLLDEGEEDIEYDIVNIDTNLLRVPKLLTYDSSGPVENIFKMLDDLEHKEESLMAKKTAIPTSQLTVNSLKMPEPSHYSGTPNAFIIELFAMDPDQDERCGFDMLEAAFDVFPDRDYCIICLPSSHTAFPLLDHFTLVTPFSMKLRFINETLYVAHINSVRGNLRVRQAEAYDVPYINDVLEHAPRRSTLIDLFQTSVTSSLLSSYVLLSQDQPVGVVVLGPLENSTNIRNKYDLEPESRRPGTDATILAGVMCPALEPHGRWFLREVMRLSRYSTLFWISRLVAKGDACLGRNLMSLAGHMVPVRVRQPGPVITGNPDFDEICGSSSAANPFALWVIERPLTSLPKVLINNGIVVVGASRTGLAFIETLLTGPAAKYLTFTNITLVSEHGLPAVAECLSAAATCVPRAGRYADRYIKSVPYYFYIDVMCAVMLKIDRKKKCIYLKGGGVKYYDELVLTCGQQFQHPDYLKESLGHVKELEKGKACEWVTMDDPRYLPDRVPPPPDLPDNVMLINSIYDANICLRKLLIMISDAKDREIHLSEEYKVLVYGECVDAYSCLAALLELGLSPAHVAFVEPFPPEDTGAMRVNCFNDETIDTRVSAVLDSLQIRVYRRCRLISCTHVANRVRAIRVMSPVHYIEIPCFALFYYGLRAIDVHAFKAINECGLVYDGGLVVGPQFETNDRHIFGAGTCTKYSRKLYADRRCHRLYSSEDVGQALSTMFLRKLDPFLIGNSRGLESDTLPRFTSSILSFRESHHSTGSSTASSSLMMRKWQPVMKFDSPIGQSAILPGPLYYMKLHKPGPEFPMEVQLSLPQQGHTLQTDMYGNYFCLKLNKLHCVEAVTCLSKKPFSADVFARLYGKHEAFFNQLLARFMSNKIVDLYDFFTQPWMSTLYQDTFEDLLGDIDDQEIGTVNDLVEKFSPTSSTMCRVASTEIPADNVSTAVPKGRTVKKLGTFRSVIDRFAARASGVVLECGQSPSVRSDTAEFWKSIGGDDIVSAHLKRYLIKNSVNNPHYAMPK